MHRFLIALIGHPEEKLEDLARVRISVVSLPIEVMEEGQYTPTPDRRALEKAIYELVRAEGELNEKPRKVMVVSLQDAEAYISQPRLEYEIMSGTSL